MEMDIVKEKNRTWKIIRPINKICCDYAYGILNLHVRKKKETT